MSAPSKARPSWVHGLRRAVRRAAVAGVVAGLAACAATPGPAAWPVEGPYWKLQALQGLGPVPAAARESHLLLQRSAGRATGFTGCNRFTAAYERQGSAIRFKAGASTRMACREGMEQEQAFLKVLDAARSWRIEGDRLQLLDASGGMLAEFSVGSERFVCDDGKTVMAHHDHRDPQRTEAIVAFDGEVYTMRGAPAASGARYVVERGRTPGLSLEWRTRGNEGLLLEAASNEAPQPSTPRTIARCTRP